MGLRFIVTGCRGQLGRCLVRSLEARVSDRLERALSHAEFDLDDPGAVDRLFDDLRGNPPDVMVNAAAFTAVDRCESEHALAWRVNAEAPGHLARLCRENGVRLVHVSTDYVFDGQARSPYGEDSKTAPRSAYGRSKLEGERRVLASAGEVLVVRTSWVYGPGRNFLGSVLAQAQSRRDAADATPLRVVDDQRGIPTYAADLSEGILALLEKGATGLVHLRNQADPNGVSWWTLARAVLDMSECEDVAIEAIQTAALDLPAERPMYSVLDCSRAARLGVELRPWREAVADFLASPDAAVMRGSA